MIRMPITEEMKSQAMEWSMVQSNYFEGHSSYKNPTGLTETERYFKGYLGELVFYNLLKGYIKDCTHYVHLNCRSAKPDFEFTDAVFDKHIIDTKANILKNTSYRRTQPKLLVFQKHYDPKVFYVAIDIPYNYTHGDIIGFSDGGSLIWDKFAGKEPKGRYYRDHVNLAPIQMLLNIIPQGETRRTVIE